MQWLCLTPGWFIRRSRRSRRTTVDYDPYAKLIEFHLDNGADALAVTMHAGESVSLSAIVNSARMIDLAIKQVNGRVPVIAHASDSGTQIAADRARSAQEAGAPPIVATTPVLLDAAAGDGAGAFGEIGAAVDDPVSRLLHAAEMGGTKISTEQVLKLIERLPNFAGVVDASLDWQFMINIISNAQRVRKEFQLMSGTEYMVSAGAIGATTMFSPPLPAWRRG